MASGDLEVLELKPPSSTVYNEAINDNQIQHFRIHDISYNDFYWQYMERNYPIVLMEVSTQWECRLHWIKQTTEELKQIETVDNRLVPPTQTATINYDYLKEKIGNCQVPVANCNREYFNSHAKCEMSFYDFLHYWQQKRIGSLDDREISTELSNIDNKTTTTEDLFYLKDWHLKAQNADYDFYKVPKHFASDWLNEHLVETKSDDYRFVYIGPKNTWYVRTYEY